MLNKTLLSGLSVLSTFYLQNAKKFVLSLGIKCSDEAPLMSNILQSKRMSTSIGKSTEEREQISEA